MRTCRKCGIEIAGRNTLYCDSCRVIRKKETNRASVDRYQARIKAKKVNKVENPDNLTDDEKELLLLYTPGPLGKGLTEEEIAKELGISRRAVRSRLERFQSHYPEAWSRLESIINTAKRQAHNANQHPMSWDNYDNDYSSRNDYDIYDTF